MSAGGLLGLVLVLLVGVEGVIKDATLQQLFNTPYRPQDSKHFDVRRHTHT